MRKVSPYENIYYINDTLNANRVGRRFNIMKVNNECLVCLIYSRTFISCLAAAGELL